MKRVLCVLSVLVVGCSQPVESSTAVSINSWVAEERAFREAQERDAYWLYVRDFVRDGKKWGPR